MKLYSNLLRALKEIVFASCGFTAGGGGGGGGGGNGGGFPRAEIDPGKQT